MRMKTNKINYYQFQADNLTILIKAKNVTKFPRAMILQFTYEIINWLIEWSTCEMNSYKFKSD